MEKYKLIANRECYDGSTEYGIKIGEYDTYEEAKEAYNNYKKHDGPNCYSGLEIICPEEY